MKQILLSYLLIAFCYCLPINLYGIEDTLSLSRYVDIVMKYHPLVQKANLNTEIQEAYVLKGKGVLDPKIKSDYLTKDYSDKDYYNIWDTKVTMPTKLPVDFAVGYERNNGLFLNPDSTLPDNGLVYGTINLSVLRGLLFDQQRFEIQNTELSGIKSQIEREILVREVLFQAVDSYLEWAQAHYEMDLLENFLDLVNQRHVNVVQLYINGDKPAIDTLESRLNINSAEKLLLDATGNLVKTIQKVNLFLWDENGNPLVLNGGIFPEGLTQLTQDLYQIAVMADPAFDNDPLIKKIENNINVLELENRLEREQFKPQLDLKYNTLLNLGDVDNDIQFSPNDYKYGIAFSMPILNRKTRGQIRLNEAIIKQNELDQTHYLATLETKYDALLDRYEIQTQQLATIEEKIDNSNLLYEAELLKFDIGESSIFLINTRERKLLEANIELIKNTGKLGYLINELYYLKLGQGL